jgi:tetratricopeptide (TPR) repeat protein
MERNRFPSALELITGKFLRHTPEFYHWRIDDRIEKLKYEPDNLAYYDDLAVAYEKTGQHDKAIETILIKDKKKPGLYETESNLGTFLMLSGKLEEGLKHIDLALKINPDAHFGREKYQKLLAEYMMSRRKNGKLILPLLRSDDPQSITFAVFVARARTGKPDAGRLDEDERKAAIKAVLGMMRFANYDSPVILEVLGDLFLNFNLNPHEDSSKDEKHLAARAYLKASYAMNEEKPRNEYRAKAAEAISMQRKYSQVDEGLKLEELEVSFKQELAQADEWFRGVRENELTWIRDGKDPEQEFTKLYYLEPQVDADPSEVLSPGPFFRRTAVGYVIAGLTCVGVPFALVVTWFVVRMRSRPNYL